MDVQLPDGTVGQFPDDMHPNDIEAVLQKQFPSTGQDIASSVGSGLARAIPNAIDIPAAAAATGAEYLQNKLNGTSQPLGQMFQQNMQNGLNAGMNKVVGPAYQPKTEWGSLANGITQGGIVGALTGGIGGLISGMGGGLGSQAASDVVGPDAPMGLKIGAGLLGGAIGGLGATGLLNGGQNFMQNRGWIGQPATGDLPIPANAEAAMQNSVDAVRNQADIANQGVNQAYQTASDMGGTVPSGLIQGRLLPAAQQATREATLAQGGNPIGLIRSTENMAGQSDNVPISDLEVLRKAAVRGQGSQDPIVANANTQFKRAYDDFLSNSTPELSLRGEDAVNAFQQARQARAQYGQTYEQGLNGERATLDQVVSQPNMTPATAIQKVLNTKQAAQNAQDMITAAGDQADEVKNGLRQAWLMNLKDKSLARDGQIDRGKWATNIQSAFGKGGQADLAATLLSPDEINVLKNSGTKGSIENVLEKMSGLGAHMAAMPLAMAASHLLGSGGGEGALLGGMSEFVPTAARGALNSIQSARITNAYRGLLSSPYGQYVPTQGLLSARQGMQGGLLGSIPTINVRPNNMGINGRGY